MIHLADLRHSYRPPAGSADASSTVLDFASWQVAEGEQVALMGGSGSGKTTLLNLVAGLLLPDAGRVKVAGIELTGLGEARRDRFRAEHVGYVFQSFHLLDGFTARENVELGSVFARGAEAHGRAGRERATAGRRRHRGIHSQQYGRGRGRCRPCGGPAVGCGGAGAGA
ncbi:MAG: ATP-binding cassette domain-containing protein, partial [Planctomycetota bacterium]